MNHNDTIITLEYLLKKGIHRYSSDNLLCVDIKLDNIDCILVKKITGFYPLYEMYIKNTNTYNCDINVLYQNLYDPNDCSYSTTISFYNLYLPNQNIKNIVKILFFTDLTFISKLFRSLNITSYYLILLNSLDFLLNENYLKINNSFKFITKIYNNKINNESLNYFNPEKIKYYINKFKNIKTIDVINNIKIFINKYFNTNIKNINTLDKISNQLHNFIYILNCINNSKKKYIYFYKYMLSNHSLSYYIIKCEYNIINYDFISIYKEIYSVINTSDYICFTI